MGIACAKNPDYGHYGYLAGASGRNDGGAAVGTGGAGGAGAARGGPTPGLALTPPMGWNSWNKFQGNVGDFVIRQIADAMVTSGTVWTLYIQNG